MRRCFIFSAGSFYGICERPLRGDLVIAADAGFLLCERLGIAPDMVIGDFDSMEKPQTCANCIQVPVEKDDTDTMLAVRSGLAAGCRDFHIYGGTGGARLDHTVACFQTLAYICRHGGRGWLYDDGFVWTVLENDTLQMERTVENGLVSLFAMESCVEDVTLTGLQYPLEHGTLTADFPVGVSNHFTASRAAVTCGRGLLLVGYEQKGEEK